MSLSAEADLLHAVLLWLLLCGLYLLFAGSIDWSELIAGIIAAAVAALFARALRLVSRRRFELSRDALGVFGKAALGALPDTARVGLVLLQAVLRRPLEEVGDVVSEPGPPNDGAPADAARRALVVLGQSLSPNGYVVSVGDRSLRLHRLAGPHV